MNFIVMPTPKQPPPNNKGYSEGEERAFDYAP